MTTPKNCSGSDYFYKIKINHGRGGGYDVYYRTAMHLSPDNVAKYAVRDGDLINVDLQFVENVLEITSEEYFEHMWE